MNFPRRTFSSLVAFYAPRIAVSISISGWFDAKWLRFSGKSLGAFGVAKHRLTIPPFHPNRVISENHFEFSDSYISPTKPSKPLHDFRSSESNQMLYLNDIFDDALLFWHGDSPERTPFMIYRITPTEEVAWYVSAPPNHADFDFIKGISRSEALSILQTNTVEQGAAAKP